MRSSTYTPSHAYQLSSVEKKVFVGGLPLGATETDLRNHFGSFGFVLRVDMPLSKSGEKKGFAIVHFDGSYGVENALSVRVHEVRGKRVAVRRALDSAEASQATKSMQEKKVFASGFPGTATEEAVFELFSVFGKVLRILSPKGGVCKRGFCYVIMKDKEDFDYLVSLGELAFRGCQVSVQPACTKHLLKEQPVFKKRNTHTPAFHPPTTGRSQQPHQERTLPEREALPSSSHGAGLPRHRLRDADLVQHRLDQRTRGRDEPPYSPSPFPLDSSSPFESANHVFGHNSTAAYPEHHASFSDDAQGSGTWPANYSSLPQASLRHRVNTDPLAYEFKDKYTSKKNLNYLTGILPGLDPNERVEVEIVQDINTVVTIRDKNKTSAIKAIFEEQTTYYGDF